MAENDLERTEAPTPRRQQEAREQGNVARSQDLTAASALLAAVVLLHFLGLRLMSGMRLNLQDMLGASVLGRPVPSDDLIALSLHAAKTAFLSAAPLMLSIGAVALAVSLGQVGFLFTTQPLQPNLTKLSPLRGLKNLLDARAGIRLAMALAKVVVISLVAAVAIWWDLPRILLLARLEPMPMFGAACELVFFLALKLAGLLLLLAIFDYAFQRWQRLRDLRMTRHEVKEELKRMEGDPLVKQRRSRVARQLAMQRIGQAVPKADVVVTNPTHFAVAIHYDSQTMQAPRVVAKGADLLALRIRQLAAVHAVPMVERKELAQALYRTVEVGQTIPPQFYSAVAEILAYVYRLSGKKTA